MGPILIFDKSTLQSLSVDESVWLENFFNTNLTNLFYVETLADIEKKVKNNFTPEQVVGNLALKVPQDSTPNVNYLKLLILNLLGVTVEMSNRPNIERGVIKRTSNGRVGVYYEPFLEAEALNRWQEGKFLEIERNFARKWRQSISNINFDYMIGLVKNIIPKGKKFKNLKEVKDFVDYFVVGNYKELYYLAFNMLKVPEINHKKIIFRWEKQNRPHLSEFAPYAAYVLKINLFFFICLNSSFISKDRPSNMIDIAYLYYLPFCMVFTSNDKLHERVAPLFMEQNQIFIKGDDLKISLGELDNYYSQYPEEVKNQGVMKFAVNPPEKIKTLVKDIWDKSLMIWGKKDSKEKEKPIESNKSEKESVKRIKRLIHEAEVIENDSQIPEEDIDHVVFKRKMLIKKGKWRLLPKEVEKNLRKDKEP